MKKKTSKKRLSRHSVKAKLLIVPIIMVILAVSVISFVSNYNTKENLVREMSRNGHFILEEFVSKLDANTRALAIMEDMIEEDIREAARIVMRLGDEVNSERIAEIAEDFNVDEINFFSPAGVIIHSSIPDYVGWTASEDHPLYSFFQEDEAELMEEIRQDSESDAYYKYGTVKISNGGAVQVGIPADTVSDLTAQFSYQKLLNELALKEEVVFASFLDKDIQAMAHSNLDEIGKDYSQKEGMTSVIVDGLPHAFEYSYGEENIAVYDIALPVEIDGEIVGAVNLGFSMEFVNATIAKNNWIGIITGLVSMLLIAAVLFFPSNDIIRTLTAFKMHMNGMAEGDFSRLIPESHLNRKDEFGEVAHSVNRMQTSITNSLKSVSMNSQMLASHSQQLTATIHESTIAATEVAFAIEGIANGAVEQAKDTEQGFESITLLGDVVTENTNKMKELNDSILKVNKLKDEGIELITDLLEKTRLTTEVTGEIKEIISGTSESAGKITEASEMIKSIAEQTNLLALNASIEAARAGDAGRGFAVVADEIRKLAEQTNQFTGEISTVIQALSNETSAAVKTMDEASHIVDSQSTGVSRTSEKFDGIADSIEDMERVIQLVNESSHGLAKEKENIAKIMEHLAAVSEENASGTEQASASVEEQTAAMEEISSSSAELAKIAEELNLQVEQFKV